ncbi:MAG: AMP-dependent synthetase/ligase [Gemmatimonadota bacterium]
MQTIVDAFLSHAARTPDRVAWRTMDGATVSWAQWAVLSQQVAGALAASGVRPGDRVAVLADNSLVWPIADMGALLAGAVSVGLYPTSSAEQVAEVLRDCGARVLIVDDATQLAKVQKVRDQLESIETIVGWGDVGAPATPWAEWMAAAREFAPVHAEPDDDAVLIYTSGSTGVPKGARISHRCLVETARSITQVLGLTPDDTSLSFLPFCHAAERMFGHAARIWVGMEAMLVDDVARVFEAAAAYHPTLFGGLPRFFEKAHEKFEAASLLPGTDAERAQRTREVRASLFGERLRVATSGGAPLSELVGKALDARGVRVLGAYGQTEHLCVAMHRPDRVNFTTVGLPMPGTELRIADDGEVLVKRGPLTFSGYFGRDDETREAFTTDGVWLKTGDLGNVDAEGFLCITGRKKEILVLSTGKKVAPLPIEAALCAGPWIEHAMLYGEGRSFITALFTVRDVPLRLLADREGLPWSRNDLLEHDAVRREVQARVTQVNAELSRHEQVKKWVLVPDTFSVDDGVLTPTMKLKRHEVAARYAPLLDRLYE